MGVVLGTFDGGYPRNESLSYAFGYGRPFIILSFGYLWISDYMGFDIFILFYICQ